MLDQLIDQPLHLLWGYGVVITFWAASGIPRMGPLAVLGGALAALVLCLPRELVDQWPIERVGDMLLDTSFFVLGGALAGTTAWIVNVQRRSS